MLVNLHHFTSLPDPNAVTALPMYGCQKETECFASVLHSGCDFYSVIMITNGLTDTVYVLCKDAL